MPDTNHTVDLETIELAEDNGLWAAGTIDGRHFSGTVYPGDTRFWNFDNGDRLNIEQADAADQAVVATYRNRRGSFHAR